MALNGAAQTNIAMYTQTPPAQGGVKLPLVMIPYGVNLHFLGRSAELQTLKDTLNPSAEASVNLRAIGIHGLGGIGKSQLARHYALSSRDVFDVIVWIPAESQTKIVQALTILAKELGLTHGEGDIDYESVQKIRGWLNTTDKFFLLIFDNVKDVGLLNHIWPATNKASIIITTRSPSQASKRTSTVLPLKPLFPHPDPTSDWVSISDGKSLLTSLTSIKLNESAVSAAADEICECIGGLPLALVQVAGFIRDRNYTYVEFLEMFESSAEKIFAKADIPVDYDRTVLTTWDESIDTLSAEARTLLNLLVFLDPDLVTERLITATRAEFAEEVLKFLTDDFDFGEAVGELIQTSMVTRLPEAKALSMYRFVQFALFLRMTPAVRVQAFDLAARILYHDFPNTWRDGGAHQGHGFASWDTCSAILPHVRRLMDISRKHKVISANPALWQELVFRTGTYIWEKEQPELAHTFFEFGLEIKPETGLPGPTAAQIHRFLGHIFIDLARPNAALQNYQQALDLLVKSESPATETLPIADICDSIACAYAEAGDVEKAFSFLDRATSIHQAHDPSKMSRTLAIKAMTCLRARQPEAALQALESCWKLQNLTREQVKASPYPKHSGDIILLARILWIQADKRDKAQKFAFRATSMRWSTYGKKGGPRVADSLFHEARMFEELGQSQMASTRLSQIVDICGRDDDAAAAEMKPHLARALWFSAKLEKKAGNTIKARTMGSRAKEVRGGIRGKEWSDEDSDEGFERLVTWMLW